MVVSTSCRRSTCSADSSANACAGRGASATAAAVSARRLERREAEVETGPGSAAVWLLASLQCIASHDVYYHTLVAMRLQMRVQQWCLVLGRLYRLNAWQTACPTIISPVVACRGLATTRHAAALLSAPAG